MSTSSNGTKLGMAGVWGWNAKKKKYTWWMFNDWGYSQEGTADYDAESRSWTMDYVSVGLDGTKSYGRYGMKVVNNDTLEWRMDEWADLTRMFKKMEMTGTYKRRK